MNTQSATATTDSADPAELEKIAVQAQNRSEAQLETWLSQGDQRAVEAVQQQREVSQQTFDAAVRENIEDFEMEIEEAIEDTKTQFEIQNLFCTQVLCGPDRYKKVGCPVEDEAPMKVR